MTSTKQLWYTDTWYRWTDHQNTHLTAAGETKEAMRPTGTTCHCVGLETPSSATLKTECSN